MTTVWTAMAQDSCVHLQPGAFPQNSNWHTYSSHSCPGTAGKVSHTHTHTHTHMHTHRHTHTRTHTHSHTRVHVHTRAHTHTHTHICMRSHTHTHTHIHTHTYACAHTHTHTHTHTALTRFPAGMCVCLTLCLIPDQLPAAIIGHGKLIISNATAILETSHLTVNNCQITSFKPVLWSLSQAETT